MDEKLLVLREKSTTAKRMVGELAGKRKILILNDIHAPFHREDTILETVKAHKDEVSTIILGGDVMDCEDISSFPKELRRPLIQEMIITYKLLKKIRKLVPHADIIIIWGNHEYRFVRHLQDKGNALNPLHSNNILDEVVGGFTHHDRYTNKRTVYPPIDGITVINKWYMQYGDMIIAHPKNFSRINLRTARSTVDHFIAKGWNFNVLFIGHTHKWGAASYLGKWFGETGCLCYPMDYSDTGNVGYTPQDYGYLMVTQVNGITDINESRLYKLDLEDGEKEWQEFVEDQ